MKKPKMKPGTALEHNPSGSIAVLSEDGMWLIVDHLGGFALTPKEFNKDRRHADGGGWTRTDAESWEAWR
jgi:hypothetical protein